MPGIGAECASASDPATKQDSFLPKGHWEIDIGYRYQPSHRHYIGDTEQKQRAAQHTEVVNHINLLDIGASYAITNRFNLNISVPIIISSRLIPGEIFRLHGIPGAQDQVYHSSGIGDVAVSLRMWMLRPPAENRGNISFGIGIKLPTGDPGQKTTVPLPGGGTARLVDDWSIQPGDGGVGMTLDTAAFKGIGRFTIFGTATYLFNPRDTNGVLTGRSRPSEAVMSVADEYQARAGVVFAIPKLKSVSFSLGGRIEGVPATDVFGGNDGFRRPGYGVSVEPGIIYARRADVWTVSVPIAVYRNRTRSVPDLQDNTWGDAAFADYIITVGYSHRF